MARRDDDNVIPFRPRKGRKWTRPEDFGHDPGKPPRPPKKPKRDWTPLAAWAAIATVVAATIAWHFWA
jgi:hypothetical protein